MVFTSSMLAQSDRQLLEKTLVVVNLNDPDSLPIAQHYVRQRGIPDGNIIELRTPTKETISVAEYVETVSNPLLDHLLENDWVQGVKAEAPDFYGRDRMTIVAHSIPYLVLIKGVPLRIANDSNHIEPGLEQLPKQFRVNNASVDSELAVLLAPANVPMAALVPNPYFDKSSVSGIDANQVLRVARLDGATRKQVVDLIDRSLEAEQIGLMGRAYIDTGGPHAKGDEWLRAAGEMAEAAHFDIDFESSQRALDHRDRLDAPAIYMGWYRPRAQAQWRAPRWPVPSGAIAFHLHSFSATSVRDGRTWVSAFVAQGYCATVGNVYEPYLENTHRPHILLAHLLAGGRFGDAAMMSIPVLSWQGVAIGDPFFRPFKVDLATQLEQSVDSPFAAYASLREINRLVAEGDRAAALSFARAQFVNQPSLALAYRLARLYAAEGKDREAVEALKIIRYITAFSADEYVLVQKIANFFHKRGEGARALELYKTLLEARGLKTSLRISLLEAGASVAQDEGEGAKASRWRLEARQLKTPPKKN